MIDRVARLLEAAYAGYAAMIPPVDRRSEPPLEIVLFEKPEEWEAYTIRLTGQEAPVYLSVGSGGYTLNGKVVCWLFNEADVWGVLAHEGFHQFLARTLPLRLPPALEEGIATTFESITVTDRQVTIDRRNNARRQQGLAEAAAAGKLIPLAELVRAHAGDVAGKELVVREGFYAQCWALARLMLEDLKYGDRMRQLLTDLRDGRAVPVIGRTTGDSVYHPASVQPLLMRYFEQDWAVFEKAYRAFLTQNGSASQTPE